MKKRARTTPEKKKPQYLKLHIDTRDGAKRVQKNIGKMEAILKKVLPPEDFAKIGKPQVRRLRELADALLIEADQLHDLWLKARE